MPEEQKPTKLNQMLGMRTVEDPRKIPDNKSVELQNIEVKDGKDIIRHGFTKLLATKLSEGITGLYDYRDRHGVGTVVIGDGNLLSFGGYYSVAAPASIEVDTAFNLNITYRDIWGNRDYGYNGTVTITEDGDGSWSGGAQTKTLVQGYGVISLTYTGGSAGTLTITCTDTVDSSITGYDTATVTVNPFSIVYTLSTRATHYLNSKTSSNGSSIYGGDLYFVSSTYDVAIEAIGDNQDIEVVKVNSSNTGSNPATLNATDLWLGLSITELNGDLYVGTGIGGLLYKSTDGINFASHATMETVIYALHEFGGKYYAGTGYGGSIQVSSDLASWSEDKATGHIGVMDFTEFDGKLWAATSSGNEVLGGDYGVFRRDGDADWALTYTGSLTQIFAMEVFGGKLFTAEHDELSITDGIVRSSSDGSTFATVLNTGVDFCKALCLHDSKLFAGCANGLIYYTTNGTDWSSATSPTDEDIYSLSSYNSLLYCTTENAIYSFSP